MEYPHTDQTAHGQLRLVFDDRVISRWLGADTTLGDIAAALSELGPRRYGDPVAIDVTLADFPERCSAPRVMPAWLKFEDDPAAEFESAASPSALFRDPDHAVRMRA